MFVLCGVCMVYGLMLMFWVGWVCIVLDVCGFGRVCDLVRLVFLGLFCGFVILPWCFCFVCWGGLVIDSFLGLCWGI